MKKGLFLLFICTAFWGNVGAQESIISGVVINNYDSSRVPYARVSLAGGNTLTVTDAKGHFRLPANSASELLKFGVNALGIDTVFTFRPPYPKTFLLRVVPQGFEIGGATIRGLTAKEVVAEAVRRIPENYPTTGYFFHGFYRQYHRLDSAFLNLVEAKMITIIHPETGNKRLKAKYRFLPLAMRRQTYRYLPVEGVNDNDGIVEEVFSADPVYHLSNSSLTGAVFHYSQYRFDSVVADPQNYILHYRSELSSEDHGLVTHPGAFPGESYEVGTLTIDRKSFAFVHIERKTFRNKWFNYEFPYNNNFIMPNKLHAGEFLEGQLDIWYKRHKDRWILARLRHGFTNEFFRTGLLGYGRECAIGQFFEWKTDSITRTVAKDLIPLFYEGPFLHLVEIPKDTLLPGAIPTFFLFPQKESV